jgi:UDP-N-acetylmuramoylalanine-D-glutamate ligase
MAGLFRSRLSALQRLRAILAILAGRFLTFVLRSLGRGATTLPGKVALTIEPQLLRLLTAGRTVYLITGTNGKTTTVRILCTILEGLGLPVITNPSGANLDSGLTTTLIDHAPLLRQKTIGEGDLAIVFEIDEAFFAKLAASIQPTVCVVTNFFRDQLDRYGELAHTRDLIARGLADSDAKVVLCADDSLCASLARGREERCVFFGLEAQAMQPGPPARSVNPPTAHSAAHATPTRPMPTATSGSSSARAAASAARTRTWPLRRGKARTKQRQAKALKARCSS